MVTEMKSSTGARLNNTPSLSLEGVEEMVANHLKKRPKVGEGKPYWMPVRGIVRWEQRQHYYQDGKRKTRKLKSQKRKPRGI